MNELEEIEINVIPPAEEHIEIKEREFPTIKSSNRSAVERGEYDMECEDA